METIILVLGCCPAEAGSNASVLAHIQLGHTSPKRPGYFVMVDVQNSESVPGKDIDAACSKMVQRPA